MNNDITSRTNPVVKRMKALATDPGARREMGEFICDGRKLLEEALLEGALITCLLIGSSADERLAEAMRGRGVPCYRLPDDLLSYCAAVKTVTDAVFSCRIPEASDTVKDGTSLLLDGLSDPGNVGTVIRTADAFAIRTVLVSEGTADPYSPKAVRASMGSIFRTRIVRGGRAELADMLEKNKVPLYSTVLSRLSRPPEEFDLSGACIALGSESAGVSAEIVGRSSGEIFIPMPGSAESLNVGVAAGIICYVASRGREQ